MTSLAYYHVDAFADRPFTGNQAAVIPLDKWLPEARLQAIAEENNFAETAFIVPDDSGEADYALRWFTPACEVALCGHATLASGHVVLSEIEPGRRTVRFATRKAGVLKVSREQDGYALSLPASPPSPKDLPDMIEALGGEAESSHWHEAGYALIVYPGAAQVRALDPDMRALAAFGDTMFIATARGKGDDAGTDVVSRVFVPGVGVDEDSVTGAAHAVLTPYWCDRLGRERFTAFQASARGGHLRCRIEGDRAVLGGKCVTVVEGTMRL